MLDTPTKYCEIFPGLIFEPFNTLSNFAFIIVAIVTYYLLKKEKGQLKFIFPSLLILIGISSAYWHSKHTVFGDIADTWSIIIFASTVAILALNQLFHSRFVKFLYLLVFVTTALSAEQLDYLNGSLPYTVLLIGFIFIGIHYIRRFGDPAIRRLVLYATLSFTIAIVFRSIDQTTCLQIPIGTHFLWHIFVAIFSYQFIMLITKVSKLQ